MNTKTNVLNALLLTAALGFTACDKENDPQPQVLLETQTATDIPADPTGERGAPPNFTFFDLETGQVLSKADSNSTKWDLAFAGTTVIVNSGVSGPGKGSATLVDGIFDDISTAPVEGYAKDTQEGYAIPTGSGNGWYTYTGQSTPSYAILPIPGKVVVLTTGDGNFAKVEILSYYKGNPDTSTPEFADRSTRAEARHYTFRYMVQTNGSKQF